MFLGYSCVCAGLDRGILQLSCCRLLVLLCMYCCILPVAAVQVCLTLRRCCCLAATHWTVHWCWATSERWSHTWCHTRRHSDWACLERPLLCRPLWVLRSLLPLEVCILHLTLTRCFYVSAHLIDEARGIMFSVCMSVSVCSPGWRHSLTSLMSTCIYLI